MEYSSNSVLVAQSKIKLLQNLAKSVDLNERDPSVLNFIEAQLNDAEEMIFDMSERSEESNSNEGQITLTKEDDES